MSDKEKKRKQFPKTLNYYLYNIHDFKQSLLAKIELQNKFTNGGVPICSDVEMNPNQLAVTNAIMASMEPHLFRRGNDE